MTRSSEITFIGAKADLMEKYIKSEEVRKFRQEVHQSLALVPTYTNWTSKTSVEFDRELDRRIEVEELMNPLFTPVDVANLFSELRARFGFSRLGVSPQKIAKRVLKRNRIIGDEEATIVKDLLSGGAFVKISAELSINERGTLERLLSSYGTGRKTGEA